MNSKRSNLVAICCLLLITIVWGWPLLRELKTALPGPPTFIDITEFIWNTGWVRQALTSEASLFETKALLVPFESDLRLNAFGLLIGLMAFPLTAVLGVVGAYNVVVLLTFFLNGAVGYAFLRSEVGDSRAALVGATWFMLSTPVLGQIGNGRAALGAMWIVAGALWALKRTLDRPRPLNGLFLGLFLVAALLTDFHILFISALWLALYGAYRVFIVREVPLDRSRLYALGLAGMVVLVPFTAVYLPVLTGVESAGYPRPGFSSMAFYSFQIQHYFTPSLWPLVVGGFELVITAVLAVFLFRRRRGYLVWLLGAAVFLLLALGPYLQPTKLPLPFAVLSLLEPLRQFRTPSRLTLAVAFGLSVVAVYVLAHLIARIRSRKVLIAIVALLIGGKLVMTLVQNPFVIQTYPTYEFYDQIATEAGDFTLLEVPFGVRSGLERIGSGGEVVQYYQHIHGKRLIGGSMARVPSAVFEFYRQHPALLFLSGEETAETEDKLSEDLLTVLAWSEAGYVLLHRSMLDVETAEMMERFLDNQPSLARLGVEDDLVIYRVERLQK